MIQQAIHLQPQRPADTYGNLGRTDQLKRLGSMATVADTGLNPLLP